MGHGSYCPSTVDADTIQQLIATAERDESAVAARQQLCHVLASVFRRMGLQLWVGGYLIGSDRPSGRSLFGFGSDATVGIATVVQIAGELTAGAVLALEHPKPL
jgi:hypothetical protein